MKFFKSIDFLEVLLKTQSETPQGYYGNEVIAISMERAMNAKLEREGKVVVSCDNNMEHPLCSWFEPRDTAAKQFYKALLINIEPIEKCSHPREKITFRPLMKDIYVCECGAGVKPKGFEEIK